MRGPTPNLMLVEKGSGFSLRVRRFPKFKASLVKLHGKLYIPHALDTSNMTMIGLNKDGNPYYYTFAAKEIENLEPYGDLLEHVVVGIKGISGCK